ncbi:MAG: ABC transporter permease [Treponema sp.]|jgi:rhamnose transport system permease protein|nr:ABC transporter permease [Treponema sp.]
MERSEMKAISIIKRSYRELSILVLVFVIYTAVCIIQPRFFSPAAVINIFLFFPYLLLIALGEMVEVISRNIDLSLGSILAFSGYIVCLIFIRNREFPILLAIIIAVGFGAFLGLINGLIVTNFKIPSVIVTLGTMGIFRGTIFIIGGKQIDNYLIPKALIRLSQPKESVINVPYSVLIALGLAFLVSLFLRNHRLGREIYTAGSNPYAAELRGIRNKKITLFVFAFAGGISGLASMIFLSRVGYLDPGTAGKGLEFIAIASVVIGGCSMNGGIGTTLGTVIGCLLLGVINNAISITGVSVLWQEAVYGLIIIASIVIDNALKKRLGKA